MKKTKTTSHFLANCKASRLFCCLLLSMTLFGCGGQSAYIADKVKFRVIFSKSLVQVSFQLNADYQLTKTIENSFSDLGLVFLRAKNKGGASDVGSRLRVDLIGKGWPSQELREFPNGERLPSSVPSSRVNEWSTYVDQNKIGILYEIAPKLLVGGSAISERFAALPRNFLATQKFRGANGDVQATISVFGPTDKSPGGIYFIGNFGENPFKVPSNETTQMSLVDDLPAVDLKEWELKADSPLVIISSPVLF